MSADGVTHGRTLAPAREKVLSGATQLANAVRVTLGPESKSILMQNKWGGPTVCNDGVIFAYRIDLPDPEGNLGAQILREAAWRRVMPSATARVRQQCWLLRCLPMRWKVGVDGVVSIEESKTIETVVEIMEGMRLDRGSVSPYFVTDLEKMQVELDEPDLLLCDPKVGILKDLLGYWT